MVGLVGESGSGKSVTARTVLGLWPDRSEVEGSRARRATARSSTASRERLLELRRSEVSMIFQDPRAGINPIRRVGDFLTESLRLNHRWSEGAGPRHGARAAARGRASTMPSGTSGSTRTSSRAACCSG